VRALSNCDEVELWRQYRPRPAGDAAQFRTQMGVRYAPGVLAAKGFNGGRVVAETKIETTGAPAGMQLSRPGAIDANGEDVSVVTVAIADPGRIVPVAADAVASNSPAGPDPRVGNGDPSCHEPDVMVATAPLRTVPVADWRWKKIADAYARICPRKELSSTTRAGENGRQCGERSARMGEMACFAPGSWSRRRTSPRRPLSCGLARLTAAVRCA